MCSSLWLFDMLYVAFCICFYSVCSLQFCDMSFWGNCSCLFVVLTCLLIDILYVTSEPINDDDDDDEFNVRQTVGQRAGQL